MISCWFLSAAILLDKKVRSRDFNIYLLFSILPEVIYSTIVFSSNLANMIPDEGNPNACTTIGSVSAYWFTANMWMGALVFRELYKLLLASKKFERYSPSSKRIVMQSTAVHLYAIVFGVIPLIDKFYIPKATPNTACEPIPVTRSQNIFFWTFFCPATILLPGLFVIIICFRIQHEELIPGSGGKRALLFYFARLIVLIFTLTIIVLIAFTFEGWTQAVAFIFFNLTGFFQVILAILKNDVKVACTQLITCHGYNEDDPDPENAQRTFSTYGFHSIRRLTSRRSQSKFSEPSIVTITAVPDTSTTCLESSKDPC